MTKNSITASPRLATVNFLRGYSIFTIVVMHLVQSYPLPGWADKAFSFGGAGVHVFILCSGFGLYLSHLNKPMGYKGFLLRRFGRIYYPMAVMCLLTAAWMWFIGKDFLWPLLGNLLLFKMFVPELECSMGGQMWFISTIIQFYLAWPLIVRLMKYRAGWWAALVISLMWSTVVGITGHSEERVWSSFFLQYLWEFCLGMKLAEVYRQHPPFFAHIPWKWLLPLCAVGMLLTGWMGWMGFPWKLYNDLPSLMGYAGLALILYQMKMKWANAFFVYTNKFSYEWYLVHILVFAIVKHFLPDNFGTLSEGILCLLLSYVAGIGYQRLFAK